MAKDKIATRKPQELAPYEQELMNEARDERAKETLGVPRITHRGGVIQIDGKQVQGNRLKLAVIDYIFEKTYFEGKFDPTKPATPDCYAFGTEEKSMVAHEAAPHKQNLKPDGTSPCIDCKWNKFNTAEIGRGKRCKDYRRLLVISPLLGQDGLPRNGDLQKAEKRQLQIPPASLKNWGNYLSSLPERTRTGNVREMIMEVSAQPLKNGGHGLTFEPVAPVSAETLQGIMALRKQSQGVLTQPWPNIETEGAPEPPKRSAKSNRKLD